MDRHGSAASSVRSPVGNWLVRSLRGDARPLDVVALGPGLIPDQSQKSFRALLD
jgi:hypothetical protein